MKKYLVKGSNIAELISKTASTLKVSPLDIKYEILKSTKNILGKIKEVELKVWVESSSEEKIDENNNIEVNSTVEEKEIKKDIFNEIDNNTVEEEIKEENFEIQILKGGIYLKVKKDMEISAGKEQCIFDEIVKREIKNPIVSEIKAALLTKKGEFVKIAEYDKDYYIDAKAKITVVKKDMEAVLEIIPPSKGNHITKEIIEVEIQKLSLKFGVKEDMIEKAIKERIYNKSIVIAEGKEAIDGEDAK